MDRVSESGASNQVSRDQTGTGQRAGDMPQNKQDLQDASQQFSKSLHRGEAEAAAGKGTALPGRTPGPTDGMPGGLQRGLQDDSATPQQLAGDQVLRGMQGNPADAAPVTETAVARSDELSEIADKLAQRILVSDRTQSDPSEVHVKLNDTTLQGSEIIFRKDGDRVSITFEVPNGDVGTRLDANKGELQQLLMTRLNTDDPNRVQIDVRTQAETDSDTGDGRSRNQYHRPEDNDGD